jgi:hypothetical protein
MSKRTVILCLLPMPLAAVALWQLDIQQLVGLLTVLVTTAGACAWSLWHGRARRPPRVRVPGTVRSHAVEVRHGVGSTASAARVRRVRASLAAHESAGSPGVYVAKGLADLEAFLRSTAPLQTSEDDLRPPAI